MLRHFVPDSSYVSNFGPLPENQCVFISLPTSFEVPDYFHCTNAS